jgi:hemolysin activation/secretion protein
VSTESAFGHRAGSAGSWAFSSLLAAIFLLAAGAGSAGPPSAGVFLQQLRDVDAFYEQRGRLMAGPGDRAAWTSREPVKGTETGPSGPEPPAMSTNTHRLWVSTIDIPDSEVLSPAVLSRMAEPLEQRMVGLDELQRLVADINALYRERNLVTARAILPAQDIVDGVVRIELIEARVDRIEVVDNASTRDGYITRRLALTEGAFADVNVLEDALRAFNAVNDVQLSATLRPGSEPHTTSYVLRVAEPDNRRLAVFVDNAGRETIGSERLGVSYTNNSLSGRRDRLSAGISKADGADAGFLIYNVPLNRFGTRAMLGFDYSQIVIVSGELAAFDVRGRSTIASAFLSHPLRVAPRWSLYGLAGLSVKDSATDFDGVDRFESAVRTASLGADLQRLGERFMLYARPRVNVGAKRFGGDESFTTLNGDAGAIINAGTSHQFALRLRGQLASEGQLPSAEQFQLGGTATVRGYPEGLLIGDEGYFVSAEYRYAGLAGGRHHAWQPFLFADHGGVFAEAAQSPDKRRHLTSVGLGVSYQFTDKLTTNVQVGFPLSNRTGLDDDYAVHFQLSFLPF